MNNYKNLKLWEKSIELAVEIYALVGKFPMEEKFGLASQIKRSAVSISSNIAEGSGRNSLKEFKNFLAYSYGSACELETQLIIAEKVKLIGKNDLKELQTQITEIQKMNFALSKSLLKKETQD